VPVRSLSSSVLKWPTKDEVTQALSLWAASVASRDPNIRRIGYRGSYADGTWGVGSDIDVVIVVASTTRDFLERGRDFDLTGLPVPADLLVYTAGEAVERDDLKSTVWVR
jgi:hypothetical protein